MRARLAWLAVLVATVALATAYLAGGGPAAAGSALSRGPLGWAAARAYVEARGTAVTLLDRPLTDAPYGAGVLLLVFPWQRWELSDVGEAVARQLRDGGDVVFAFSGDARVGPGESQAAGALGLTSRLLRDRAPLTPRAWRRHAEEEWAIALEGTGGVLRVRAYARGYDAPPAATALAREPDGRTAAFAFERHRGRVLVLPAAALANASLSQPAAGDLLETLRAGRDRPWTFAEHPHGLVAPGSPAATASRRTFDLWLLHLAVVYVLALLALARPFGPVWSDPPARTGSAAVFLRGLGALHRRLGHEHRAAELLVDRTRELDPHFEPRPRTPGAGLLALAQETAARRRSTARRDG
ncbi:MAG: DUF4350 domain-containing protein [Vicinamibacteria bacterium]